jgi:hypothetical protein
MKKLEVGTRVRLHGYDFSGHWVTGKKAVVVRGVNREGDVLVWIDGTAVRDWTSVHSRQCRVLRKAKPRHEIWVPNADGEAYSIVFTRESLPMWLAVSPQPGLEHKYRHYREVKQKGHK